MYEMNEDTDPGVGLKRTESFRALRETTHFLGRHRRLFVPLGVLALVALGVHAAADRFDDWTFRLLDAIDHGMEWAFGHFADAVLSQSAQAKIDFANLFTLHDKEVASRWVALAVELLLDLRLGIGAIGELERDELEYVIPGSGVGDRLAAVFGKPLARLKSFGRFARRYLLHTSVEKLYLPVAVFLAVVAGAFALDTTLDNAFFSLGHRLPDAWHAWRWLSPWPAAIASIVVAWRLAIPAVVGSLARGEAVMKRDVSSGEPFLRRTLRGAWGAALILPILVAGLLAGSPILGWWHRIFSGGHT